MTFDVQAYLRSLSRFGLKPGLDRIRALLAGLGNPERSFPAAHVGGTNAKGSIAAMTSAVLREAGYRVGMYTSPHLVRYHERIQVDGVPISDAELEQVFEEVAQVATGVSRALGSDPTEFDVGTAAAFLHFARRGVDVAVVEVGLGGRWDSTNVLESRVVALGPISLDHTAVLGPDIASITREKVGIFRRNVPAVIAPQQEEAVAVIRKAGEEFGAPLLWVKEVEDAQPATDRLQAGMRLEKDGFTAYRPGEWGTWGGRFDAVTPWRSFDDLRISLLGRHQMQNAAVALSVVDALAADGFAIPAEAIRRGLASTQWPGRLERVSGDPEILLDGVHNPGGAEVLRVALEHLFPGRPIVFVMAVLGEKDALGILRPLLPLGRRVIFTRPASSRVPPTDPAQLARLAASLGVPASTADRAADALDQARAFAGPGGLVVVCGSLYLVGEVRAHLSAETGSTA